MSKNHVVSHTQMVTLKDAKTALAATINAEQIETHFTQNPEVASLEKEPNLLAFEQVNAFKSPCDTTLLSLSDLQHQYQTLQQRYSALFRINQLSQACEGLHDFYFQVHRTIATLMPAENFFIVNYELSDDTIEFAYYVDEKDPKPEGVIYLDDIEGSYTQLIIESAQPLLVTPALERQLKLNNITKVHGSEGTDWLGVPLIDKGIVVGVIAIQSYSETLRYTEQELDLLSFTAQHVVHAMVRIQDKQVLKNAINARTQELILQIQEREKAEKLQKSLYGISELTNDISIDIEKFYFKVHRIVKQLINANNFFIAGFSPQETGDLFDDLNFVYYEDEHSNCSEGDIKPSELSLHFSKQVLKTQKTTLLSKQDILGFYQKTYGVYQVNHIHSWLGVPLFYADKLLGLMVIHSYQEHILYTKEEAKLLQFVSTHIATAIKRREEADVERRHSELLEQQVQLRTADLQSEVIQRRSVEKKLKHAASHDELTGLLNRKFFIKLLNRKISQSKQDKTLQFAIIFLDLDRFKMVNDTFGHYAGDVLLKEISKELIHIVGNKDTVARLGGDEFIILLKDIEKQEDAHEVALRITNFISKPFIIENQFVYIGASTGVLFNHEMYHSANIMIRDADTAMYYAKANGRGRYEVFDSSMHKKVQEALRLEADIREALEWNEFSPYFQPIVNLANRQLSGFEALARWHSKKRGFVNPDDFIPLAEEHDLVQKIDFQVLLKACEQLKVWHEKFNRNDLFISCNLYSKHFFSSTLPRDIQKILKKTGLSAKHLRIELTERVLLEKTDIVLTNMNALKKLGIKLLLDDFGTGYSSLSYLHHFPIDVLKIDRSFIANVHQNNNKAIIKTIIDLATNLNMLTVVEGIASMEDAALLQSMNCLYGQGYYFAKPMSNIETERYINSEVTCLPTL